MDLNPSAADRAFRDEVRAFVRDNLPADISEAMLAQKNLRLGQNSEQARKEVSAPAAPKAVTVGDPAILQRTVSELELSVRSRKCLQRLGVSTLGELAARSEAELLAIKNFGQTSLVEIKRRLNEVGLSLRTVKR